MYEGGLAYRNHGLFPKDLASAPTLNPSVCLILLCARRPLQQPRGSDARTGGNVPKAAARGLKPTHRTLISQIAFIPEVIAASGKRGAPLKRWASGREESYPTQNQKFM